MAISHTNPPPVDYSSRDYASIRADGLVLIPLFLPEYTDHNQTDPGIMILGLFSAAEDRLNYYVDIASLQSNITTAITRTAIVNHAKMLNYQPSGPDAAQVDLTLTIGAPIGGPGDLTVPAGTQLTASNGEIYELDADAVFPFDGITTELTGVGATHGETIDELVVVSDGRADQSYELRQYPVLDDPFTVTVNAVSWDETTALPLQDYDDQVFYRQRNENDHVKVFFGDGVHGAIPPYNQDVRCIYRVGGGVEGQIEAGAIDESQNIAYGAPPVISVSFTNPLASSGGAEHEGDEAVRANAPKNWGTQERCVTSADYEVKAEAVSGVGKAQAVPRYINEMLIYIGPSGGGTASAALLTSVETALEDFKMATDSVTAISASYVDLVVSGTVYVFEDYERSSVETATETAVESLMTFDNRTFGSNSTAVGDVKFSNLVGAVENVTGVDYIILDTFRIEPSVTYHTWNGDLEIQNIATNDETVAETWTIQFISTTEFTVTGSVSGTQTTTGTVGTSYVSDDGRIAFDMSAVAVLSPVFGDKATFRVSQYIETDNIRVLEGQIARLQSTNLSLTFTGGIE